MIGFWLFVVDVCIVEVVVDVVFYWLDEGLGEVGVVVIVGMCGGYLCLFVFDLFGNCCWWIDCFWWYFIDLFGGLVVWCYCNGCCFVVIIGVLYLYL